MVSTFHGTSTIDRFDETVPWDYAIPIPFSKIVK